jgi:cytochrome o ubiquinol oxidase subunit 2
MAGMKTKLHLVATRRGIFEGLNSQYNGEGFSDMHFKVHVVSDQQFNNWVNSLQKSNRKLSGTVYQALRQPSIADSVKYYNGVKPGLFMQIIQSYNASEHP